jgi:segregation and condensation protein B
METLAIIAYRQPITRGEVEEIRGVDSGQVFHTLLERNLVTVKGRSQALGRPLLYGTTEEFLRYFGLNSLVDLPSPQELEALLGEDPLDDPEIRRALASNGFEPVAGAGDADAGMSDPTMPESGDDPAEAMPGQGDDPAGATSGNGGEPHLGPCA